MAAHQHDGPVAERLGESVAELVVADQHIGHARRIANVEDGRAGAKKCAHVIDGAQDRPGHAEGDDRGRMAMNDGLHVRPRAINRRVDKPLEVHGTAARVERLAIPVELENIAGSDKRRRNAARQKESVGVLVVTRADVAEGIHHTLVGQDAVGVDEVFDELGIGRARGRCRCLRRPDGCGEGYRSAERGNDGHFEFRHADFSPRNRQFNRLQTVRNAIPSRVDCTKRGVFDQNQSCARRIFRETGKKASSRSGIAHFVENNLH